uniref:F-box domain-containing protein n=1 Tax=Heterorhabditis bacteriophora TaxID=37862 RepID=A0A1I7WV33_HETBA
MSLTLQDVDGIHRSYSLAFSVFALGNSVVNHILEKHLQHTTSFLIYEYFYLALLNVARCDVDVEASQDSDIAAFTTETDESQLVDVAFSILPPKIQIKILTEVKLTWKSHCPTLVAALNSPSHRLINIFQTRMNASEIRHARHLTKQTMFHITFTEAAPGAYSVERRSEHNVKVISIEDFPRICAHCHFQSIEMGEKEFFWMPSVRKNPVSPSMPYIGMRS